MNTERTRVTAGLAVVSFVWGSTWLAIKIGLESVPPFFGAGIRFVVAACVLYVLVRVRRVRVPFTPEARRLYLEMGFFAFGVPYALVYWGEQYIPSGLCNVLFAGYPFWVALFARALLKNQRLEPLMIAGIVLGFAGLVTIFQGDLQLSNPAGLLGMSAVILCTITQGFALVMIKKHGQTASPFAMNLVGMTIGSILLLGLALVAGERVPSVWTAASVGSILYLSVVGSVLAFVTYYWLLKRVNPVYLSLTTFINPIVALLLGTIVLGESLTPNVFLGAGLVLAGILTANAKQLYATVYAAEKS